MTGAVSNVPGRRLPGWLPLLLIFLGVLAGGPGVEASEGCSAAAIRFEYPVSLYFSDLADGDDWSGAQIRVFDAQRNQVVSRGLGRDLTLYDAIWTPLENFQLPWGAYTLEATLAGAAAFQHNFSVPRDKEAIVGEFRTLGSNRRLSTRNPQRLRQEVVGAAGAGVESRHISGLSGARLEHEGAGGGAGGSGGRKLLSDHGCGLGCVCDDICCAAPPACREIGETCLVSLSVFSRDVVMTCRDGACNVTVDAAPACTNRPCLADTCFSDAPPVCSFLTPNACGDCETCAHVGLAIWCSDPAVPNSGVCKAPSDPVRYIPPTFVHRLCATTDH